MYGPWNTIQVLGNEQPFAHEAGSYTQDVVHSQIPSTQLFNEHSELTVYASAD